MSEIIRLKAADGHALDAYRAEINLIVQRWLQDGAIAISAAAAKRSA